MNKLGDIFQVEMPKLESRGLHERTGEIRAFMEKYINSAQHRRQTQKLGIFDPRGLSRLMLESYKDQFLSDTIIKLYRVKKTIYRDNFKVRKGRVVELKQSKDNRMFCNVLDKSRKIKEIIFNNSELEVLKKSEWTVRDVVDFYISKSLQKNNFSSMNECFAHEEDHMSKTSFESDESDEIPNLGKYFEGGYVICSRDAIFCDLLNSMINFAEKNEIIYLSFDFFGTNEFERKAMHTNKSKNHVKNRRKFISEEIPTILKSYDQVLVYIDDWKNPDVFSRSWCIYELFISINHRMPVNLVYCTKINNKFIEVIENEFEYDYYSYHDIRTTLFSIFDNLENQYLFSSNNNLDEKLISTSFLKYKINEKTKFKTILLDLYSQSIVKLGNEALTRLYTKHSTMTINEKNKYIHYLRGCSFYLQHTEYYKYSLMFNKNCCSFVKAIKLDTLVDVKDRSYLLCKIYLDEISCRESLILKLCSLNQKKKMAREIIRVLSLIKVVEQHLCLLNASYCCLRFKTKLTTKLSLIGFSSDVRQLEFDNIEEEYKNEEEIGFYLKSSEKRILLKRVEEVKNHLIKLSFRPEVERQTLLNEFSGKNSVLFLRAKGIKSATNKDIAKFVDNVKKKSRNLTLLRTRKQYLVGLLSIVSAGIDLKRKAICSNHQPKALLNIEFAPFREAIRIYKAHGGCLSHRVFQMMDVVLIFKLLKNQAQLNEELTDIREVISEIKGENKSNAIKKLSSRVFYEKGMYLKRIERPDKAKEQFKRGLEIISNFHDIRSKQFRRLLEGEIGEEKKRIFQRASVLGEFPEVTASFQFSNFISAREEDYEDNEEEGGEEEERNI